MLELHNVLVKPDRWTIPKEVSEIHGITDEIAKIGLPEKQVAALFYDMVRKSTLLVAHNITFDKFIARIALRRFDIFTDAEDEWWKGLQTFCTMHKTTDICCIPHASGRGNKWPKLEEAYRHIFKKPLEGAHSALADVTACKDIYFWLQKGGAK